MHEHLLRRFKITEEVYLQYDQTAKVQYENRDQFIEYMNRAASLLLFHLNDFSVIETYLREEHQRFGLERASLLRIQATKRNIEELAAFFRHLAEADRPLHFGVMVQYLSKTQPRSGEHEQDFNRMINRLTFSLNIWALTGLFSL